jgi:heterodisulfide reductase subunit A2
MAEKSEETLMATDQKVGVYVCHCGGNISDHVDVEKVCRNAERIPGVTSVKHNMFMCSDPGQELIMEDLKEGAIDRVVVASCAPALHETTFRNAISRAGFNPFMYDHANIREQVSWVHHGDQATLKASRLVAAATAKAKRLKPLEPFRVDAKKHATVIGGGVAGLKAAIDLAERGIEVVLIEKSPFLGGWTAKWDRIYPTDDPVSQLLGELIREVLNHSSITVHNCSSVTGFGGYIGNFELSVKRAAPDSGAYDDQIERMNVSGKALGEFIPFAGVCPQNIPEMDEELNIETGVIVLSTGFKPYTPNKGEYGYNDLKEVITLPELIRIIAENREKGGGGDALIVNGRKIQNMAMIHCVGSRQIPGFHKADEQGNLNEYCSRTCCSTTLHNANIIREAHPGTRVFDFYRDIRTYGRGQEEIYDAASKNKVVFFRFDVQEPPVIVRNSWTNDDYPLLVKVKDTLTFGEEVEVPVDLVVLSVGMEPGDVSDLVEKMKLSQGPDRFLLEVHPKLRPLELSVAGILLAGTCQAPFDVGEACAAASGAGVKASAILARGFVELDPYVAEVDLEKCKGTGACVTACLSEGALELLEMTVDGAKVKRAQVNPAHCEGCGACTAVCPEGAINVLGWSLQQYEDMVDMIVSDQIAA